MKNIINKIGVFALSCLAFTSCDSDDNTGDSILNYSPATVTLSSSSPTTFAESGINTDVASTYQIEITATLAEAQPVDAVIDLVQSGGSADAGDFEAHTITIPAGSLTSSATVDILQTGEIEGTETLEITGKSRANFDIAPYTFSATISDDYVTDFLDIELNWDGEVTIDEDNVTATYNLCAMDFDILIYDASFADTGIYDAATGACPEHVSFGSGMPDGDYIIVVDLYGNDLSGLELGETVAVNLNYSQDNFDNSGTITNTSDYTTDSAGGTIAIATVTKSGYNYTVAPF